MFSSLVLSNPAFRLEYSWENKENPFADENEENTRNFYEQDPNFYENENEGRTHQLSKRDDLNDDARRLYNDKSTVEDPAMSAMQGSILLEQRNELAALKDDSAFEDSALSSLQEDARKMDSDERKVDDDRRRKFGKHKKKFTDKPVKSKDEEDSADLYTKIRQFSDSLGPVTNEDSNDIDNDEERDKRSRIEREDFDLSEDMLQDFATSSVPNKKRRKKSFIRQATSSESPSEILGNIAKIFENVNDKNHALLVRKRKEMSRDTIPHPRDIYSTHDWSRESSRDNIPSPDSLREKSPNEDEEEIDSRRIKNVIPRAPQVNSKYDVIEHQPHNNKVPSFIFSPLL